MSFAHSLSIRPDTVHLAARHRARVQVLCRDPFGSFARAALLETLLRITVVSPWLRDLEAREASLGRLLSHAQRHAAAVVLVTRPAISGAHAEAINAVDRMPRGFVYLNPRLHAKLYVCESVCGPGLAVVGSANCTDRSASLDEIGLLVRPEGGSQIITHLGRDAVRSLSGSGIGRRPERSGT